MTTTVIFDLDGVLVDSRAVFLSCVRHAFEQLELPPRTDAELLPYLGPRGYFEVVAGPELTARAEHKTETLGRALAALGETRAVMVGDRSFDVIAARAHGIGVIGVTWGIGTAQELADADRLIAHPSELPAAADVLLGH